jgi:hypothetical protein
VPSPFLCQVSPHPFGFRAASLMRVFSLLWSHKVMGAGVSTSPHFPRFQMPSHEGATFFA